MGYTSVKGGADAIAAAELLVQFPTMDSDEQRVELRQVLHQFGAAVDQIMGEGGLYAPELGALAFRQAEGDMAEAAFMVRAYRSTLPRVGYTEPADGGEMRVHRRISAAFRDIPGGQLLGRTRDYTQRLLNLDDTAALAFDALADEDADENPELDQRLQRVSDTMRAMGIMMPKPSASEANEPDDITRDPMRFPVSRSAWLQALSRSETGALVALAYSSLRGYGASNHGTIAELRVGELQVTVINPLTGKPVTIGHVKVTECEMTGSTKELSEALHEAGGTQPGYGLSYGLVFGQNERKAISMSILDSTLFAGRHAQNGATNPPPANDQEMVLYSSDGIESFGFVEHLKLPHFVTFGSGLAVKSMGVQHDMDEGDEE